MGLVSAEPEESRSQHQRSLELDPLLAENLYELAVWSYQEAAQPGGHPSCWIVYANPCFCSTLASSDL